MPVEPSQRSRRRSPARSGRRRSSTGASFEYLLTTAQIESNLNPAAQAPTSSAKGLYQFIDQTWLATMKEAGAVARARPLRRRDRAGRRTAATTCPIPAARSAIMNLRNDPDGERHDGRRFHAQQCRAACRRDRPPADRRRTLYRAFPRRRWRRQADRRGQHSPRRNAAAMFPQAAAANRSIFYDGAGHARSVARRVRAGSTGRFEAARAATCDARAVARHARRMTAARGPRHRRGHRGAGSGGQAAPQGLG